MEHAEIIRKMTEEFDEVSNNLKNENFLDLQKFRVVRVLLVNLFITDKFFSEVTISNKVFIWVNLYILYIL